MACALRCSIRAALAALASGLIVSGCDESLPPRIPDPATTQFTARIWGGICSVQQGIPQGGGTIQIDFVNTYGEVLQDTAALDGEVDVWLVDSPQVRAHVSFDASALANSSVVSGRILTLIPGVDEQMLYEWSHKTNAGKPFYDYLPLEPVVTKSGTYLESPPVRIAMTGTLQIFRRIPPFAIPLTSATITYQVH